MPNRAWVQAPDVAGRDIVRVQQRCRAKAYSALEAHKRQLCVREEESSCDDSPLKGCHDAVERALISDLLYETVEQRMVLAHVGEPPEVYRAPRLQPSTTCQ